MRTLLPRPESIVEGGVVRFGSYRGGLPRMDLGGIEPRALQRVLRRKRWTYVAIADEQVLVGAAIVGLGYATKAIVFVLDRERGRFSVDRSRVIPGPAARFADHGPLGRSAELHAPGMRLHVADDRVAIDLRGDDGLPVHVSARVDPVAAPALGAVVPVVGGSVNATEKRLGLAHGEVVAGGRRVLLGSVGRPALAAFDHTHGLLARHTAWRWALGLGYTDDGRRLGFNLVQGFVGEAECGLWLGDELVPLGEASFDYDARDVLAPWRIRTPESALELEFEAAAAHSERTNLGLVRSEFVQPVGAFRGTLRHEGEVVAFTVPGVVEHQDVHW